MKVLYIFDEDGKYGAPKAGLEMIQILKNDFKVTPVVITSKFNEVNEVCDKLKIENYVTHHHKYTYVKSVSILKNIIKFLPRYFRYICGNILAMNIIVNRINMSEIDLIHCNISGIDLGIKLGKKYGIPNIMHIREYGEGEKEFRVKSYRYNYINYLNKKIDKFIAISDTVKKFWENKGINNDKIVRIYDGIYLEDILVKKINNDVKKIKLIMLGSIHQGKGQEELVKAIAKLTKSEKEKIHVDIIGNGFKEEEEKIRKLIKMNDLSEIVKLKNYDPNIREKLHLYDIGMNCSFAEGFGRVTVEYMAAGLCVIASNKGANMEIIENNVDGLIYDKNKSDDLVVKLRKLIDNHELRKKMSIAAIKKAITFDINKNCKEIYKMYECLGGKK